MAVGPSLKDGPERVAEMNRKRLLIGLGLGVAISYAALCPMSARADEAENDRPKFLTLGLPVSSKDIDSPPTSDDDITLTQVPPGPLTPPNVAGSSPTVGTTPTAPSPLVSALTNPDPAAPPSQAPPRFSSDSRFARRRSRLIPEMMGDGAPLGRLAQTNPPTPPTPTVPGAPPARSPISGATILPSIRQFKIAEMESPMPLDRVYYTFHYYNDVNGSINRELRSAVSAINIYREVLGLEKTFLDQRASIGLRLPINTLTSKSSAPQLGGASTAVGDLAVILKYALLTNREKGEVLSTGVLITAPTGPAQFAGSHSLQTGFHDCTFQPYVGFIKTYGNLYLHGFSSIDIPFNTNDVTVWYNDFGMGYWIYRNQDGGGALTGVAPILEGHLTTPLNHRGIHVGDLAGTPDVFNVTYGLNLELWSRSNLRVGAASPITGPNPFALEAFIQYGLRF